MTSNAVVQLLVFVLALVALGAPLGAWLARVYSGTASWTQRVLGPVERLVCRLAGVDPAEEMSWRRYAAAVLLFNVAGLVVVYALLRAHRWSSSS